MFFFCDADIGISPNTNNRIGKTINLIIHTCYRADKNFDTSDAISSNMKINIRRDSHTRIYNYINHNLFLILPLARILVLILILGQVFVLKLIELLNLRL